MTFGGGRGRGGEAGRGGETGRGEGRGQQTVTRRFENAWARLE